MKKPVKKKSAGKYILITVIILLVLVFGLIIAGVLSALFGRGVSVGLGNTAVIPIKGVIVGESSDSFFGPSLTVSTDIIEQIEKADNDPMIKAILFEINSPGGQPVATDEIVQAIKKTNKTTVAWIRDVGASAAYWIASATDYIVCHRLSLTGSVGVTASYLQFSGFLERYNITYEEFAVGEYKEVGSPFRELTDAERQMLQNILHILHEDFVNDVAANRGLTKEQTEEISKSKIYLGSQAKEFNLVDELGSEQEALDYIEEHINKTPRLVKYEKKRGFLDMLTRTMTEQSFFMGKAFRNGVFENNLEITT